MRTQKISSFADILAAMSNFDRADTALASGVAKGNTQAIQAALRAGANPLQAQDDSGRHLLLQAMGHEQGEEMVCLLLNQMPVLENVARASDGSLLLRLVGGHAMTVPAYDAEPGLVDRLFTFLCDARVWRANSPARDNEKVDLVRLRQVNRGLLEGAKEGNLARVETALTEGATVLACDPDGKPALSWASEHPNHVLLVGAMLANDPSVSLEEQGSHYRLRNLPYGRMAKGGVATYVAPDFMGESPATGHGVNVDRRFVPTTLRAHLRTLQKLGEAIHDLTVEFGHRGMPTQLQWPNQVDFQRLLADHYTQSLEEVGGDENQGTLSTHSRVIHEEQDRSALTGGGIGAVVSAQKHETRGGLGLAEPGD